MRHRPLAWLFASALLACAVAVSAEEAGEIPGPEVSPIATDRPTDSASPVLVPRHMIQFEMGVMRDRPRLARSLTARPRVKDWIIARFDEVWGAGLLGDKAASVDFDNAKLKRTVPDFHAAIPFSDGAREIIAWYDEDPARQVADPAENALMDRILQAWETALPE